MLDNVVEGAASHAATTTEALARYVQDPAAMFESLLPITSGDGRMAGWFAIGLMIGVDMERSRDGR